MNKLSSFVLLSASLFCIACARPNPAPDQTASGAVLGAAIQAGAGAVVGHQLGATGPGAAIGAGFGLISGGLVGMGLDRNEKTEAEMKTRLASIQKESAETLAELKSRQASIDYSKMRAVPAMTYQVFFDENQTNLRAGAISELEALSDAVIKNESINRLTVVGHSDDTGNADYNMKLSEKRAEAVASYLKGRGLASSMVTVESKGSTEPIAGNTSPEGRSLNRRVTVSIR